MMHRSVCVTTGSRLHFGLLAFENESGRSFGGVGVMVNQPGLRVEISTDADKLQVEGPLATRTEKLVHCYFRALGENEPRPCRVVTTAEADGFATREHVGLGTGTQLSLAVATGLQEAFDLQRRSAGELSLLMGRGQRSAIGTHGFASGGLLYEHGKLPSEGISPLLERVELPDAWRFLLLCPRRQQGRSGTDEDESFAALPQVPAETTEVLRREVESKMLPAACQGDFTRFGKSLYHYGVSAGLCFAERQHEAFATREIAKLVKEIRRHGVEGVGQSSWGPTVFALCESEQKANDLVAKLVSTSSFDEIDWTIAKAADRGAVVEVA